MAVEWVVSLAVVHSARWENAGRGGLLDSARLYSKRRFRLGAGSTLFIRSRPADVIAAPPTPRRVLPPAWACLIRDGREPGAVTSTCRSSTVAGQGDVNQHFASQLTSPCLQGSEQTSWCDPHTNVCYLNFWNIVMWNEYNRPGTLVVMTHVA